MSREDTEKKRTFLGRLSDELRRRTGSEGPSPDSPIFLPWVLAQIDEMKRQEGNADEMLDFLERTHLDIFGTPSPLAGVRTRRPPTFIFDAGDKPAAAAAHAYAKAFEEEHPSGMATEVDSRELVERAKVLLKLWHSASPVDYRPNPTGADDTARHNMSTAIRELLATWIAARDLIVDVEAGLQLVHIDEEILRDLPSIQSIRTPGSEPISGQVNDALVATSPPDSPPWWTVDKAAREGASP